MTLRNKKKTKTSFQATVLITKVCFCTCSWRFGSRRSTISIYPVIRLRRHSRQAALSCKCDKK